MYKDAYNNVKLENLQNIAREILSLIKSKLAKNNSGFSNLDSDIQKSFVIYLNGVMGAGKTTFAKAFASELGIIEDVQSPTFTIMREYDIKNSFDKLLHIDAYRFENKEEGNILGLEKIINKKENTKNEIFENKKSIILIEWAENMHSPKADMEINIEKVKDINGDSLEDERNIFIKIN